MTPDQPVQRIELTDLQSLEALVEQTSPDPSIGWSARLPVTAQTWDFWHQGRAPTGPPEIWCAHVEIVANTATAWLWVDPALPLFDGHFPGNPILPGIVQIEWARVAAGRVFPAFHDVIFAGLANIKFKTPVRPATWLKVRLSTEPAAVVFVVESTGRVCTQGRLLYRSLPRHPAGLE